MRQSLQERLPPAARASRTKLRAAVVGLGRQATDDHIPGLQASDGAVLAAICDEDPNLLHAKHEECGVAAYTD